MGWKRTPIANAEALKKLRISPSSINTFRSCSRKWFYEYVLAKETKPSISLTRGSVVHYVLEEIFKKSSYPGGEAFRKSIMDYGLKLFNDEWKKKVDKEKLSLSDSDEIAYYKESKIMIERFITHFCDTIEAGIITGAYSSERQGYYYTRPKFKELWLDDHIQYDSKGKALKDENGNKLEREDNPLIVGGFIDAVNKNFSNEYVLVDYKTSKKYQNALSDEYVLQLSIYAYLWKKNKGYYPTYVGIKYLRYDETYFILVTPSMIRSAILKIKDMRSQLIENGMDEKKYVACPSKLCEWCSFQDECAKAEEVKENGND